MKIFGQKHRGFTIIELLVVMAIIVVLSSVVMAGYWTGQKRYDVSRSTQQLISSLRQAQNMALSGRTYSASVPTGYGFYSLSSSQYCLFYNADSSKVYQEGVSVKIETVTLPADTTLTPSSASIFFTPPEPITYINGANSGSQAFVLQNGNFSRQITIYSSGLVDF
ncbi:MAG TPA: prepilin-type N-terminal cleavage/methylation domain-containing protein [Candidatus Portnoybacteria bacterium]|nr:prepilin-type N-terminal cleavage/methylation domain-containing protein [Candidatus Portnoybacteria bacterium]